MARDIGGPTPEEMGIQQSDLDSRVGLENMTRDLADAGQLAEAQEVSTKSLKETGSLPNALDVRLYKTFNIDRMRRTSGDDALQQGLDGLNDNITEKITELRVKKTEGVKDELPIDRLKNLQGAALLFSRAVSKTLQAEQLFTEKRKEAFGLYSVALIDYGQGLGSLSSSHLDMDGTSEEYKTAFSFEVAIVNLQTQVIDRLETLARTFSDAN